MNLPQFSVRRPILTSMVASIVILIGIFSLVRVRVDLLPNIELPTITVRTEYQGASPEVMERLVTQILEEIIATVPGVVEMTSESSEGRSSIRVSFGWGSNVDTAALDVQSRLEAEIDEMPEGITRPQVRKFDIGSFPVVVLGISSALDPVELTELIENQLRYRYARIPDVAQVDLWGGYPREVRIELDPDRIRALSLPLNTVLQAIRDANLDLPAGEIEHARQEITIRAPSEFQSIQDIESTVVALREGAPITLGQIATVVDTYEKLTRIVRVNGERGIRLAIRKQANANTVEVSQRVLAETAALNRAFPQIHIVPVINQGNFIERSIDNVATSVLYGGGLAIVVLLFFLLNVRSTLIIAVSIPISVIATFTLIYMGGFTLNLMTLGGLALGVGMMVDSSIVVLENVFRRKDELSESAADAAVSGAREVSGALVASTLTTLVVFLPLVFVRGVSGILFKELAYVVAFSLVCSLLISLSIVPVLASKILKENTALPTSGWWGRVASTAERWTQSITKTYVRSLSWALDHRGKTVIYASVTLAGSLVLLPFLGTDFIPPSDEGEVRVTGEMEVGSRLDLVDEKTRQMEALVYPAVPETVASVVSIGASGRSVSGATQGELRLSLTPAGERARSNVEIADDLRRRLDGKVAGMKVRVRAPQGQFLLERLLNTEDGISIEVRGFAMEVLESLADQVSEAVEAVDGITDVDRSREVGVPQQSFQIDRSKAAALGLTARDITSALQTAIAGSQAGEYRVGSNSYRILVQLQNASKLALEDVLGLTLTTASGEPVALSNLVTTEAGFGPMVIERKDQQRIITVQANVSGRDLGSVAADIQRALEDIPRPSGYDLLVAGNFEEQQAAFQELLLSLVLALVLVYMVLASQYESFRNPLIVMFSVPMGAVGVLLTLFITGTTLNVQSYIGCIMLGGIVVNNAILLVDQAGQLTSEGLDVRSALTEAGRRRLRPILMTTTTTILGLLPLALGIGEGADTQAPLARAVIGGLVGSTPVTLVLIPAVYSLLHRAPGNQREQTA